MADLHHFEKVGAHSNQETGPCDPTSLEPTVASDSQPPPTARKRRHRTLSSELQETQSDSLSHPNHRAKRQKPSTHSCSSTSSGHSSRSSCDQAKRRHWDSLSKVWLAADALQELNRRNKLLRTKAPATLDTTVNLEQPPQDITHFARHGGPDLSDIRKVRALTLLASWPC